MSEQFEQFQVEGETEKDVGGGGGKGGTSADEALAGVGEFAVVGEGTYDLQELEPAHSAVARMVPPSLSTLDERGRASMDDSILS